MTINIIGQPVDSEDYQLHMETWGEKKKTFSR
jgi:hypothetical protein